MKRLIIVLIGLWAVGTAFAQTVNESAHLSDAINTVKTFYDAFGEIAKDPETDSAMEAQKVCFELMFEPELRSFPNDFHGLDSLLMGLLFVTSFRRYQHSQPFSYNYSIVDSYPSGANDTLSMFTYVIVDKVYSDISIRDTVLLNPDNKIIGISNRNGGDAYTSYFNASPNEKSPADNPGSQTKMYTCRVQIYFDDGSVLNESKITVYWTKGGFFSTEHEGTFYTDKKGWVTISWPADEAEEIKDIYFSTGFIFMTHYHMTNLALKDGKTYRLNADSFD